MTIFHAVLLFVALQRGGELLLARANTVTLLRQGATEIDRAGHALLPEQPDIVAANVLAFLKRLHPPGD